MAKSKKVQRTRLPLSKWEMQSQLERKVREESPSIIMALFPRDEAEMNYLKIAQDLEMYGVNYFPIAVSPLF